MSKKAVRFDPDRFFSHRYCLLTVLVSFNAIIGIGVFHP